MDFQKNDLMMALTSITIQKVLRNIGNPVYEKVSNRLEKEYKCYIPDCYNHPEYLESVLRSIFGNSYMVIVEQIREELREHMDDIGIRTLVKTIGG